MITFKLNNTTVCFCFSFFAAVTMFMLFSGSSYAVYSFFACILHETGHVLMMLLCDQKIRRLIFYGAGIKIIPARNCEAENFTASAAVLGAGCAANFAVFILSGLVYGRITAFAAVNLAAGIFNMLPLSFLDGGRILVQLAYRSLPFEKALKTERTLKTADFIIVPAAAVLLYVSGVRNFTIYVTLIFLLFSSMAM